jgi:hypothetical protein
LSNLYLLRVDPQPHLNKRKKREFRGHPYCNPLYHLVKSWQFILVQLEVWYMIRSSHYSEIQESLVALCEVKCDPHVKKSSVKCGSLCSCDRGLIHD